MKYLKIAIATALVMGLMMMPFWYSHAKRRLNLNFTCDHPENGLFAAFIVDLSDPFDPVDTQRMKKEIKAAVGGLPKGTTYELLSLNAQHYYSPVEDLKTCVVPRLNEEQKALLSADQRVALDRKRVAADSQLDSVLGKMAARPELPRSPLMETLISLSKQYEFRTAAQVKVFLYSDMEQNTEAVSIYRRQPLQPIDGAAPLEQVSLRGANVSVRRIVRRTSLGIARFDRVQALWTPWFEKAGADVTWNK